MFMDGCGRLLSFVSFLFPLFQSAISSSALWWCFLNFPFRQQAYRLSMHTPIGSGLYISILVFNAYNDWIWNLSPIGSEIYHRLDPKSIHRMNLKSTYLCINLLFPFPSQSRFIIPMSEETWNQALMRRRTTPLKFSSEIRVLELLCKGTWSRTASYSAFEACSMRLILQLLKRSRTILLPPALPSMFRGMSHIQCVFANQINSF